MKIKKMVATFGNLRESELKLSDGMNVVYGANESGKSTWGAFIRAMLYGISGRERSRQGFIADKEKFAPWSGEPMYGRMEFTHDGHEFGITRSAGKSGILQKAEVTKNSVAYPLASEPGDAFLGIKREVYERTAFIAQTAMEIERDKEGELERKITALASTGEEDVSGKLVEERLGKWKRRRRHNQHGEIPELNELLNTLRRKLDAKRADSVQLTNESARQRELEARRGALEKQRAERRGISAREQLGVIEDAAHEKKEAEEKLRNISKTDIPSKEEIKRQEEKYKQYVEMRELNTNCKIKAGEIRERVTQVQQCLEAEKCVSEKPPTHLLAAVASALSVAAVCLVIFWIVAEKLNAVSIILAICAGLVAGGAAWFVARRMFYRACGVSNKNELYSKKVTRLEKMQEYAEAERARDEAQAELANTEEALKKAQAELTNALHGADICRAEEVIESAKDSRARLEGAEKEYKNAVQRLESVRVGRDVAQLEKRAAQSEEKVGGELPSEASLNSEIAENEASTRMLELNCTALKERLGQDLLLSDMEERVRETAERLDEKREEYAAIELAEETFKQVHGELAREFAPALSERAEKIFSELCGGHFDTVHIKDAALSLTVAENSAAPPRDVLSLSKGTLDELYFALRLALCESLTSDDVPIILDDALICFDDVRMARALDYLKAIAKKRQIILFSCHGREQRYFENDTSVKKIILEFSGKI